MEPIETKTDPEQLKERIAGVLRTVYDPEIPVNIYDLGLIYNLDVDESGVVDLQMTLTSPNCPVAESLPEEVKHKVRGVEGVSELKFDLVWDPPFHPDMMSEAAKLQLGML